MSSDLVRMGLRLARTTCPPTKWPGAMSSDLVRMACAWRGGECPQWRVSA